MPTASGVRKDPFAANMKQFAFDFSNRQLFGIITPPVTKGLMKVF